MNTESIRFKRTSILACFLLCVQQILFAPLLIAQDGVGSAQTEGLPQGAKIVAGTANLSVNGNNLNINSATNRTIINWNKFSVGANNGVNFNQPGVNSAVLNRVTSSNPSAIMGTINSNGNVFLINPNGILVGPSGVINTNGFTASVLDISNQDFLNGGDLTFSGDSKSSVVNLGKILTGNGGVNLLGHQVINNGLIESSGNINLATGGTVQLKNGVTYTQADSATIQNGISETASLIRNNGTIRATGAMEVGGEVYLVSPGGKVFEEGMIAASKGAEGGKVVVTGSNVELANSTIDVSGANGGGQVNIGGGFQGNDPSILNAQSTSVDSSSLISADALVSGNAGTVVVWSDAATDFAGTISATGGMNQGNGGLVEVSGMSLSMSGFVDTSAVNGDGGWLLLDPVGIRIISGPPGRFSPGTDPVLTITDGMLNNLLNFNSILLATSPANTDVLPAGGIPSGRGFPGTNDDNIVVSAGTSIETESLTPGVFNTLFFSTSTLDLHSSIRGQVAGGTSSGTTLFPPIGPVKDPSVVNVHGSGSGGTGSIQNAMDIVGSGGTINIGAGSYDSFVVSRPDLNIVGVGSDSIVNTSSPAITINANGTSISNLNLVGTGSPGDIGILLDGIATPQLNDITIQNVLIDNMEDGIVSQGLIGNGGSTDLLIEGNTMTNILRDGIQLAITDRAVAIIRNNNIGTDVNRVGDDGIDLAGVTGGGVPKADITLETNQVFSNGTAIEVSNLINGGKLTINGGNYDGLNGSLSISNTSFGFFGNGKVDIENAQFVTGPATVGVNMSHSLGRPGIDITIGNGNSITGGQSGLQVTGLNHNIVGETLSDLALSGQTSSHIVLLAGAELGPTIIDAKNVSFDGVLPTNMDVNQLLDLENKIIHFPDNPLVGFIDFGAVVIPAFSSIQLGVNFAGLNGIDTVVVPNGLYGGSVEVWVDDLRLLGQGPLTIINTNGVDFFANNGDVNSGFEITNRPGGFNGSGDVTGVTIDGFNFASLTPVPGNDGIVLGTLGSSAIDTTIQNNLFGNLDNGIVGRFIEGNTTISNVDMLLNIGQNGIWFDNSLSNVDIAIDDASIIAGDSAIRFSGSVTNSQIEILNSGLTSAAGDSINFVNTIRDSDVEVAGSTIFGFGDGINVDGLDGSTIAISSNTSINGLFGSGIEFDTLVTGSSITINDNSLISGGEEAIEFDSQVLTSQIGITGNDNIIGGLDAIQFKEDVNLSLLGISDNGLINSIAGDGISFEGEVNASLFFIGNNVALTSVLGDGVRFEDSVNLSGGLLFNNNIGSLGGDGIAFLDEVNLSAIGLVGNRVGAGQEAIQFSDDVNLSLVGILGNNLFSNGTGIAFSDFGGGSPAIDNSLVIIAANTIDGPAILPALRPTNGIAFEGISGLSTVIVRANNIIEAEQDGLIVQDAITDNALLRIRGNTFGSAGSPIGFGGFDDNGIEIDNINSTRGVEILENEVFALNNAIEFRGTIVSSNVSILDNPNLVGGDGAGIDFENNIFGTSFVDIRRNQISGFNGVSMTGVSSITGNSELTIIDNSVFALPGGSGLRLKNFGSSVPVVIDSNQINGGDFGIQILQDANTGNDGAVVLSNLLVSGALDTGILIRNSFASNSLVVTLQDNVTINGGASANDIGLVFDGPNLSLAGDTLGNTSFVGTNGNFIELRNGALFEPGQPTLIDATNVNSDGIDSNTLAGFQQIENRIVHFIDDPTLGLIWPGFTPRIDNLTYDQFGRYSDWFESLEQLIGGGYAGSMNYGNGQSQPDGTEFNNGILPNQDLNSYDVFDN